MFQKCASLLKTNLKLTISQISSSVHPSSPPFVMPLRNQAYSLLQTPLRHFQSKIKKNSVQNQSLEHQTPFPSQDMEPNTSFQSQDFEAIKILKAKTKNISLYTGPTVTDFTSRIEQKLPTIDKTAELFNLIMHRTSVFVMGPRRFGKSHNVSTVEAIFSNGLEWWKERCKNFAITQTNYEFPVHPILSFDFSGRNDLLELQDEIMDKLQSAIEIYELSDDSIKLRISNYYKTRSKVEVFSLLQAVIRKLSEKTKRGVVLLIDEYDSPVTEVLQVVLAESPDYQDLSLHPSVVEITSFLKQLFTQIKSYRRKREQGIPYLRFFYLTGCIPLSHLGLFSGPNDVLVSRRYPKYDKMIGYTKKEILDAFGGNIQNAALMIYESQANNLPSNLHKQSPSARSQESHLKAIQTEILDKIEENYDGFIFRKDQEDALYSPFAINSLFDSWENPLNISKYPAFFGNSGSSTLIWRLVKSLSLPERTKLYWTLLDGEEPEMPYTLSAKEVDENQSLEGLYRNVGRLGYYGGLFSVNKEKSKAATWRLKITNKEMKEAFLAQFENFFGLEDNYTHLIDHLIHEEYCTYFDLLNEELQKLSAFPPSTSEIRHKHEVESYGHVLFALLHERLGAFVQRQRDVSYSAQAKVQCFKDRSVSLSRNRPDCFILFDGLVPKKCEKDDGTQEKDAKEDKEANEKKEGSSDSVTFKKICFNIEFKCQNDIKEALSEAKADLDRKKNDLQGFRKTFSELENSEIIFIAAAFGGGVVKAAEFYRLQGDDLVLSGVWPQL